MAELELNFAKQYGSNVYTMAQQKGSRLRSFVTIEEMRGEKRHFDRVHPTAAVRSDSKYGDTPLIPTQFDRRTIHAREYIWADMVDWQDDLNLFIDPTSNIVRMGGFALGRIIDDIIIENAFDGVSYEGKDGLTTVAFPDAQKIDVTTGGSASNVGLNVEKLIQVRSKFGLADIDLDDPENKVYMAVTQKQIDDLVRGTDIKSRDYDAIRALGEGRTNSFYGIEFVTTGRLKKVSDGGTGFIRTCAAWCKSGIILCIPKEISMKVETRADKCDNWQALAKMKAGATRIEDAKVIQVFCEEA
ncbi:MAG: hypothetical protein IJT68_07160 [Lentisphaeria bacterium]|nr:hypothetical protein [Lentisphaeria bacterium]